MVYVFQESNDIRYSYLFIALGKSNATAHTALTLFRLSDALKARSTYRAQLSMRDRNDVDRAIMEFSEEENTDQPAVVCHGFQADHEYGKHIRLMLQTQIEAEAEEITQRAQDSVPTDRKTRH